MNEKLAANLKKLAKGTKEDAKLKFALVLKGGTGGALIVDKQILPKDIEAAKEKAGGSAVIQGTCYGEAGKIIFETGKEPAATWEQAVKNIAKHDAECTITPEFRWLKEGEGAKAEWEKRRGELDPKIQKLAGTPAQQPVKDALHDAQAKADQGHYTEAIAELDRVQKIVSEEEWGRRLNDLSPKIRQATAGGGPTAAAVRDAFNDAQKEANQAKYTNAIINLARVEKILDGNQAGGPSVKDEGARQQWTKRSQSVVPDIKAALATDHKDKDLLQKAFAKANEQAEKQDFAGAMLVLDAAYNTARKILDSAAKPVVPAEPKLFMETLASTKVAFEQFKKDAPDRAQKFVLRFHKAVELGAAHKYEDAIEALEQVQGWIAHARENMAWENDIDVKSLKLKAGGPIGAGAFGSIYLLESDKPGTPDLVLKWDNNAKKEAENYKKIGDHPNIARCLGEATIGGKSGLVMEAIKGGSLKDCMKALQTKLDSGAISHEEYWSVMQFSLQKTLQALAFIADQGMAHADIKPDNLMFDAKTGDVKVIDLGISGQEGKTMAGTPGFASSQQMNDGYGGAGDDSFAVGATAYLAGEKKTFDYKKPGGGGVAAWEFAYEQKSALDQESPALDARRNPQKKAGTYNAEAAYANYVNWLMNPTKPPTPAEALNHPFMKDRILDDKRVTDLIKAIHNPEAAKGGNPNASVTVTPGLTGAAFKKTMEDAVKAGAVADPSATIKKAMADAGKTEEVSKLTGSAIMIAEALDKLADFESRSANLTRKEKLAATLAIDNIAKGALDLLKKPDFQAHAGLKAYLEQLARDLEPKRAGFKVDRTVLPVTVTAGMSWDSFKKTLQDAADAGAIPDDGGPAAEAVATGLDQLPQLEAKYNDLDPRTQWNEVEPASVKGLAVIDQIAQGIAALLQMPDFKAHPTVKGYLEQIASAADAKRAVFALKTMPVAGPNIIADHFHDAWSAAKNAAELAFKKAVPLIVQQINHDCLRQAAPAERSAYVKAQLAKTGLTNAGNLDKFFGFTENLGAALDDFESASKKGRPAEKERGKAHAILLAYFTSVREKQKALPQGIGPDFCGPLANALRDLAESIKK